VVNRAAGGGLPISTEKEIVIGHPSGVMDLKVDARFDKGGPRIVSCTIGRTARKILDGRVYVSEKIYDSKR
jgi:2-methylaconitate cis-trans-isomerase PrpF